MKKSITILLLLIVITSSAQYRTYDAYGELLTFKKINKIDNLTNISIYWKNNDATNIDNMLRIKIGKDVFKFLSDYTAVSSSETTITYSASVIDLGSNVLSIYFTKNKDRNDTKFVIYFIDNSCSLIIYSDLSKFKL